MIKDLVSIVVPVYNVEDYLEKCVSSILKQTYNKIEVILVDDGATDRSGELCDEYAKKDNRIKVIHKANGGLSDARNVGIENASGEFICFIDSDDLIDQNFVLKHFTQLKEHNADLSICKFKTFIDENELEVLEEAKNNGPEVLNKEELTNKLFERYNVHFVSACTKVYRTSIFNAIRFDLGKLHEDEFIVYKVFDKVNKAVSLDDALYFYRARAGSITKVPTFKQRNLDSFYSVESCYNFYVGTEFEQQALNRLINSTAYIYCIAKGRKAKKNILEFLLNQYKKYYKMNSAKTLKQRLFYMFPNLIAKIKNFK